MYNSQLQARSRTVGKWWTETFKSCPMELQWAKKVSFRPETGPEFPQNGKNPKFFGTNLFLSEFSILFWTCFGAETYFFLPTVFVNETWLTAAHGWQQTPQTLQTGTQTGERTARLFLPFFQRFWAIWAMILKEKSIYSRALQSLKTPWKKRLIF